MIASAKNMPRIVLFTLSGLCLVGSMWVAATMDSGSRRSPARFARDLTRPFVLPALWAEIRQAERSGDLARSAAIGRDLLEFLPEWKDGHVHFASHIAIELGERAGDVETQLHLLEAGLSWLDEARANLPAARAATLAASQSALVEARCRDNPALAEALRKHTGKAYSEVALGYLDQAIALSPPGGNRSIREQRPFLLTQIITAAIEANDPKRALLTLDAAIGLLRRIRDQETSTLWIRALERVRPALEGEDIDLDPLLADPYSEDIARALKAARDR